jgi:hypothetical protein
MLQQGNIDVNHRPVINNADGSHSTIFSATIPINKDGSPWEGKYEDAPAYALVPQIAGGKFLTSDGKMPDRNNADQMNALEDAAIEHYAKTGEHLGIFSSGQAADNFAEKTHAYMPNGKGDQVFLPPGAGNPSVAAMDPEQRQKLIDQATNQKIKLQAEARKAADDARETAVATMDSQARAKTLTHNDLEDARTKFNLKPAEYDKLYDLIDQKPHESPSDTTIHDAMAVAIQLDPSSVTQEQLHKYYLDATAGKPGLNLTDFAKLDNLRKEGLKAENAPDSAISKLQTVAMGNLEIRLHLSPQILEAARTQLVKSPGFKTDPVGTANKIIDSNKDAIEALGGHTPTAIETRFESAQKAFLQIQKDQQEWDRIHYLTSSEKNPNNVLIIQRKQDFLYAAKAAGKDRGPAPKDKPEGKAFVGEDGRAYIVINGRTIPL